MVVLALIAPISATEARQSKFLSVPQPTANVQPGPPAPRPGLRRRLPHGCACPWPAAAHSCPQLAAGPRAWTSGELCRGKRRQHAHGEPRASCGTVPWCRYALSDTRHGQPDLYFGGWQNFLGNTEGRAPQQSSDPRGPAYPPQPQTPKPVGAAAPLGSAVPTPPRCLCGVSNPAAPCLLQLCSALPSGRGTKAARQRSLVSPPANRNTDVTSNFRPS